MLLLNHMLYYCNSQVVGGDQTPTGKPGVRS